MEADPYLAKLREVIRQISADKIASEGEERGQSYYIRKKVWRICIWKKWQHFCTERTGKRDRTEELIRKSMEECLSVWIISE